MGSAACSSASTHGKTVQDQAESMLTNLDGTTTNGADRLAHKVDVDLSGVLLELGKHLLDVGVADKADHHIELLQLDIDGVVVLDKEHLDVVCENLRTLLNHQVDVAKSDILNLGLRRQECDCNVGRQ